MARFEYTRTVEHYSFNAPSMLSEEDYNIIKMKIRMNPSAPLIDEKTVEQGHDRISMILLIGIFGLTISLITLFNSSESPGWAIIVLLISVIGVIHPILNMGVYQSSKNRLTAEKERIEYFRKLKNIVSNSPDYVTFKINYRRQFRL